MDGSTFVLFYGDYDCGFVDSTEPFDEEHLMPPPGNKAQTKVSEAAFRQAKKRLLEIREAEKSGNRIKERVDVAVDEGSEDTEDEDLVYVKTKKENDD